MGTLDVVQDALLEVWRDSVPEYLCCRGEWWLHTMETFEMVCYQATQRNLYR
jgi:hypothetical protein